ncbi:hypothetical protein [Streptomyces spinoverrucosus]|uniref:hypothetical protein n=1 Tax=Streptomyces spinoverrucosus TaxID=284043 RepID=UPI0019AC2369|nr:hypothetical protein [Streptomyces spinoverrucosus]GHB96550.1 hypothetical protein GCM10010397_81470 [Streptomyces spinoverrucosus]
MTDVAGVEVARLSLVPPVYVTRAMAALRTAEPVPTTGLDALLAAGDAFASGAVGGLGVREYEHLVSRTSGVPLTVVRRYQGKRLHWCAGARSREWRRLHVSALGSRATC